MSSDSAQVRAGHQRLANKSQSGRERQRKGERERGTAAEKIGNDLSDYLIPTNAYKEFSKLFLQAKRLNQEW